jgi:glucose/arabinose dehydrogenase
MNGGWVQIMGPVSRFAEFRQIETTFSEPPNQPVPALQQLRWPPTNLAATGAEALSRLFMLPGAHYKDPEFSWRHAVAPAGIGFVKGEALGSEYAGTLWVGSATAETMGGALYRFQLTADRQHIATSDSRIQDGVADNPEEHDPAESESLIIGSNFGIVTHIQTGPNGHLYVVRAMDGSTPNSGALYEIMRRQ